MSSREEDLLRLGRSGKSLQRWPSRQDPSDQKDLGLQKSRKEQKLRGKNVPQTLKEQGKVSVAGPENKGGARPQRGQKTRAVCVLSLLSQGPPPSTPKTKLSQVQSNHKLLRKYSDFIFLFLFLLLVKEESFYFTNRWSFVLFPQAG